MKVKNLLILVLFGIVAIGIWIYPVNAETGTISVSDIFSSGTYTFTLVDGNPRTYTFSTLLFDNTDYNHISSFTIYISNSAFFILESNYTTFTVVSGGTGNGYITYSKTGKYIDYNFNSGTIITGSQVGLSLDLNIFDANNMNAAIGSTTFTGQAQSSTKPICIRTSINQCLFNGAGVSGAVSYAAIVSKTLTNGYEVTYPQPNKYLVNITKWGAIGTEIKIHNQTTEQFTESSFNLINFTSPVLLQTTGIYINVTTSTGAFNDVLINSSGVPGAPTPTPTPPTIPSGQSSAISFDRTSYIVNDIGTITTNYTFGFFDFISTYRVDFYSNNIPLISQFTLDQSLSTQSFQVSFPQTGIYTANIVKSTPLFGDSIMATATVQASVGTSYIFSPDVVPVGRSFQVGYIYGLNTTNTIGTGLYVYRIDSQTGNEILERVFINSTTPIISGTRYNVGVYVDQQSDYILKLREANITTPLTTQIITSTFGIVPPPTTNITTSFINTDKTNYFYSDYMTINYGIDNTNWTCCGYVFRIDGYSNVLNLATFTRSVGSQTSILSFVIDGTTVNEYYVTGAYDMRLIAKNDTSEVTITNTSITILNSTTDGYSIVPTPREACSGTQINIKVITPSISQFHIALNGQSISGYPRTVNGTNRINQAFNTAGTYQLYLFDNITSEMKFSSSFTIKSCTTPTPPTTQAASQTASDLSGLLQNKVFWGLVFIIGIMLLIAVYERKGK